MSILHQPHPIDLRHRPSRAFWLTLAISATLVAASTSSASGQSSTAQDQFAAFVRAYYGLGQAPAWDGLDKLSGVRWAPAPTELKNCLPNGDCFARQGTATIGGRNFAMVASGARTMVVNLLIRNVSAPLGDSALVAALGRTGFATTLARCPVRVGAEGTNWYKLTGAGGDEGFISIQPAGPGRPNEGYTLSQGTELPQLQPAQLSMYSERCAAGSERKVVSSSKPHEELASLVVTLLAKGAALYDWKTLAGLSAITWNGSGPVRSDLTARGDANPVSQTGSVKLAGREFSVMASGTPAQVRTIYLDEVGRHPKGEHMLGVVYEKGIAVRLVRCGPMYTESTNNWYNLQGSATRPANIRQSINYDGNNVSDAYELRLDGTLPTRDPRDRNPGSNGC